VGPRAGLGDVKRKFLTVPGLELRPLGSRARSQSLYISDGTSWKSRIAKIASTFTTEALAIGETLEEIIDKIDSKQNFVIFSDSESVPKGISNTTTLHNNTSHITQIPKYKIERLESRGEKIQFYWILGRCGLEVNERADPEAKQSIKEGRDSQLLLPVAELKAQWKKKDKAELHSFCQNSKRDRGGSYSESY
jgi:ribonuclease HI